MTETAQTLRDLLVRAARKHGTDTGPASTHQLERIAKAAGHQIVYTTIANIINGTYALKGKRPRRATLEAIAFLAGVPYAVVYEAAGRKAAPGRSFSEQIPEYFDELTLAQRDVVLSVGRALWEAQQTHRAERVNETLVRIDSSDESIAYLTEEDLNGPDELTPSG